MSAHAQHRAGRSLWPWSHSGSAELIHPKDSGTASSGLATGQQEGPPAAGMTPAGRSWPIDANPADVDAARRWLAEFADRFPASLPPPPYGHPSIGPLLELVQGGRNAAAVLDSALRHCEDLVDYLEGRGYE